MIIGYDASILDLNMNQARTIKLHYRQRIDTIIVRDGKFTAIKIPLSIGSDQTQATNCPILCVHCSTKNYQSIICVYIYALFTITQQ